MSQDATSQPSEPTTVIPSATEDDQAQQMLAVAATQTTPDAAAGSDTAAQPESATTDEDKLGDNGRRALTSERQARRAAERELKTLRERLSAFEDSQKTELQKAQEAAQRYESELTTTRVANARLMAAVAHDLPPDLIDLLGDGTEEEIDARAKLLAQKLAAAAPSPSAVETKPAPASARPVESLTPGGKPASAEPEDPNVWIRRLAGRAP
ncbi:hypothetical protein ACGFNU_21325 [Spirillospora sp. NPDC048911]|uniref:hypothetical protein n=1 Tax=Spirillospora sp. NPDC048911 TaxID=3364527 RepID=UPI00371573E8